MIYRKNRVSAKDGFTLMEVIVAIAILGISFVLVMQLFAGGLRLSRASCDYTRAVVHAKDKMEELAYDQSQDSGEFDDGYRWEAVIEPYRELEELSLNLLKVKVKVSWGDVSERQKSVELVSLKTVSTDENL